MTTSEVRPLHVIAAEIKQTWPKPYFGAVPYIEAMSSMGDIAEPFGFDAGDSIVLYFLSNARRGAARMPAASKPTRSILTSIAATTD